MSECTSASRGIVPVRQVFPRLAPIGLGPAPLSMTSACRQISGEEGEVRPKRPRDSTGSLARICSHSLGVPHCGSPDLFHQIIMPRHVQRARPRCRTESSWLRAGQVWACVYATALQPVNAAAELVCRGRVVVLVSYVMSTAAVGRAILLSV